MARAKRRCMHGKRLKRSPIRQDSTSTSKVDTTFIDRVFNKQRVNSELEKDNRYTTGDARGLKKSKEHYTGVKVGGGSETFLGEIN